MDIFELKAQGYSIRKIAEMTGHSRNSVRQYLRAEEIPKRKPAPPQPSKLNSYKALIKHLVLDKSADNCEILLRKLREQGYTGGKRIRTTWGACSPPKNRRPSYVTRPRQASSSASLLRHALCYSRDLYVELVPRADLETLSFHSVLLDLAKALGLLFTVCRPYRAETKGYAELIVM